MNKISPSPSSFYNTQIDSLPDDIISLIFSNLPKENLPSTTRVCRSWKNLTLDLANNKEPILRFTKFIIANVEQKELSIDQKEILKNIYEHPVISEPKNLLEIKSSTLDLKVKILQLLCTFSNEEVLHLKNISETIPGFFEDIFILSEIYRTNHSGILTNYQIIYYLVHIDEGIEIARTLTDIRIQNQLLQDAALILIHLSHLDKAFEIAESLTDEDQQSWVLQIISKKFFDQKNFEKAREVARAILDEKMSEKILYSIDSVDNFSESINMEEIKQILKKGVSHISRIARQSIHLAAALAGRSIALSTRLIKKWI